MSDQNLVWSDILANEIIRTRLNVWQFLDWSDIMSDHFRKVIIPTGQMEQFSWSSTFLSAFSAIVKELGVVQLYS